MEFSHNTVGLYPGLGLEDTIRACMAHGYRTFEQWNVSAEDLIRTYKEHRRIPYGSGGGFILGGQQAQSCCFFVYSTPR